MSSFFLKRIARLSIFFGIATFVFSFTVDLWVERKLPFIETALSEALERPVHIRHAGYDAFRGFFLDDLTVKEIKTVPFPFTIRRVRAVPSFALYPAPKITFHKLVFEEPVLGLAGRPEELFRAGALVRRMPVYRAKVGAVHLEMKIAVFEIKNGRVTVFTRVRGGEVRQEFEEIGFFAGKRWLRDDVMRLSGHIAGKPQARFRIASDLLREAPGSFNGDIRIDLREFTTAYLAPYLKERFELPEKNLTASLQIKVRDGRKIESSGKIDLLSIGLDGRLRYSLEAVYDKNALDFSKIEFKGRALRLSGKGHVELAEGRETYDFHLDSGKIAAEKFRHLLKPWILDSGFLRLSLDASGSAKTMEPKASLFLDNLSLHHAARDWRISKMVGELLITPRGVRMNELWAFLNDMPFRAAGKGLFWNGPRSFALDISTYPGQLPGLKPLNPLNGSFFIRAAERRSSWRGYFSTNLDAYHSGKPSRMTVVTAFKGLDTRKAECQWLALHALKNDGKDLGRSFALHSLHYAARIGLDNARLDIGHARLYGGNARGSFRIGLKDRSWKTRWDVQGTEFRAISNSFLHAYPANGRFALRASAAGGLQKELVLGLRFRLTDGSVGPSPAMADWAAQTGIESLRLVRFRTFSGNAYFKAGAWDLEKLKFDGDAAVLEAGMKIRDHRVNGRLSARFPTNVIRPSSDLARLLRFAGQGDWMDLDFRVAGALESPRIEWMSGEFKKKVETRVPPFLREELYRRVEQRFAPAS